MKVSIVRVKVAFMQTEFIQMLKEQVSRCGHLEERDNYNSVVDVTDFILRQLYISLYCTVSEHMIK